jgi:sugar phosphate isomerase/epimerase
MQLILLALLSLSITAHAAAAGTGAYFKGPLGLQMYSLRHHTATNLPATLDKVRDFGFKTIEGGAGRGGPDEFLKLLDERGLKLVSTGGDYARLKTNTDMVITAAKKLGVKYVICGWIPHQKGNFNEQNCREAIEVFNTAGEKLNAAGLTLAFHCHGYEFHPYKDGTLFDLLVQQTKPEFVSYEIDVFWAQQGGADPAKLIEKYGNRFKLMHVKDLRKGAAINLTGAAPDSDSVPCGQGQVNWPAVLKAAQKAGLEHYFIEDESVEAINQIPITLRYLEQVSW